MLLARLLNRRLHLRPSVTLQRQWRRTEATAVLATKPAAIQLRPYQEESIQAVLSHVEKGYKRLGISLSTGSGKTVVFTRLIDRIVAPNPRAQYTLILAHRRELVEQAYRHCMLAYPDKIIEIEQGKNQASGVADITVASMQSITSKDRIEKFDPSRYKLILVDEAHHIVAPKYLEILEHFKLRPPTADSPLLVAVSATMSRFDGLKLGAAIDHIVYHKDYIEMINENWLSDVAFTTVSIKADLGKVKSGAGGDFQTAALSRAVNTSENNEATFLAWQERATGRNSTLIFCVDVKHIHDLTATFRSRGIEAHFVTGETPAKTRSEILDRFKRQEYPVLLNCGVFTEGTDIPNIDCVVLARPTKSRNLLVQMIGRGTRLFAGKINCQVIDMVSSLKVGVVTTPTLFGLDPDEMVKDASIEDMQERKKKKEEELQAQAEGSLTGGPQSQGLSGTMTFTDYDSVEDLIEDTSGEQHIRSISAFAWVQVDDSRYILSTNSGNYLTLIKGKEVGEDEERKTYYHVEYTQKLPFEIAKKSPYARPRRIANATTFEDAVHAADKYAADVFEYMFIAKNQPWRRGPASDAQLKFLNRVRDADSQSEYGNVTKGQANDMITKIKFGARGRFNKMAAGKQRVLREQEGLKRKLERVREREAVKVGPLSE